MDAKSTIVMGLMNCLYGLMHYRAILLMGAPGVGKGTQGKILGKIPGFFHLACGDVFRALDLNGEMGKSFIEYSSRGELVPDNLTIELWRQHIEKMKNLGRYKPEGECLILDGIPRNANQARILADSLNVVHVFHLIGPEREVLVQRMQRRALTDNRFDDANLDIIHKRLDIYDQECRDMVSFYGRQITSEIDATRLPYRVLSDILNDIELEVVV